MSIESELTAFLTTQTTASRDIEAVLYRYGFRDGESILPTIKKVYSIVRNAPGQNGLANLTTVLAGTNGGRKYERLMKELIKNSDDTWFNEDRNEFWYVFERYGNNRVRNYSGKLFSVVDSCEIEALIEAYHNDLKSRRKGVASSGRKYNAPPKRVLEKYFKESSLYAYSDGKISFLGDKKSLNLIEQDVVVYFVQKDLAKYDDIREYLLERGYTLSYIDTNVFKSFLVLKRDDRPNIVYSFVGKITELTRYERFRAQLESLPTTDMEGKAIGRAEQMLLRSWLFKDRKYESCGLCGEAFSTAALVAAHKKPRTECDDDERRDPYIVMPMCVFGCDFLYEQGSIVVEEGVVKAGNPIEYDGPERGRAETLIGRKIDDRWLQGPASYFDKSRV